MDDTTTRLLWVLGVSAVVVLVLLATVAGAFAWYQRQAARQARRWGRELLAAQDAERGRVAGELHDHLVPEIWAVRIAVRRAGHDAATARLDDVVAELRTIAHRLHPPALKFTRLAELLAELVREQFDDDVPEVSLDLDETLALGGDPGLAIYRVAQEGLTNVRKHAEALAVTLRLRVEDGRVVLEVEDDGVGVPEGAAQRQSFGMRSMRERLEMVGGSLEVSRGAAGGTLLRATVPAA